jgi:hypothetical protein
MSSLQSNALIPIGRRLDAFGVPRTLGPFLSDTQKVIAYLMKKFFLPIEAIMLFLPEIARPIPRPLDEMQIGVLQLWAGGHIYDDERSNFFTYRGFYPFEPRGPRFPPRWQPN